MCNKSIQLATKCQAKTPHFELFKGEYAIQSIRYIKLRKRWESNPHTDVPDPKSGAWINKAELKSIPPLGV